MKNKDITSQLLTYEVMGFSILITISWLDELADLPTLLFGATAGRNWHEAALETLIIIAAAVPTILLSRKLAKRLVYLEDFLRVCGWCKQIGVQDEWISMETYFSRELNTRTSHGICPDCASKFQKSLSTSAKPQTIEPQ